MTLAEETGGEPRPCWLPSYGRYRLHFSLPGNASLPDFPGSAWRGAFGWALRELVCVTGQADCRGCLLMAGCAYQRIFETAVKNPERGVSTHAPHPFVLHAPGPSPRALERGEIHVDLCLLGQAGELLPAVTAAMQRAAAGGVAGARNRLRLRRMDQWHHGRWEPIYRPGWDGLRLLPPESGEQPPAFPGGPVTIRLLSPLRLKQGGRLVGPERLTPRVFMYALYARMRRLAAHYAAAMDRHWPEVPQHRQFRESCLRWQELDRYSSRQGRKHGIGGLLGSFTMDLDGLEEAWPLFWHGQFLHVGKCTSMGHGAYRIQLGAD